MSFFDDFFEPSLLRAPELMATAPTSAEAEEQRQIRRLRSGIWMSASGPIPMKDMSYGHLINSLRLVTRRNRGEADAVARQMLEGEIERRRRNAWRQETNQKGQTE